MQRLAAGQQDDGRDTDMLNATKITHLPRSTARRPQTHAFLTHDWGTDGSGRDNHERVSKVNHLLKERGVVTWFDEEQMVGNVVEQMCAGIDDSITCVVFITANYLQKVAGDNDADNCKKEFLYADRRKTARLLIPVVMEQASGSQAAARKPSSWDGPVGMSLGGKMYIDLSADVETTQFVNKVDELAGEIFRLANAQQGVPSPSYVGAQMIVAAQPLDEPCPMAVQVEDAPLDSDFPVSTENPASVGASMTSASGHAALPFVVGVDGEPCQSNLAESNNSSSSKAAFFMLLCVVILLCTAWGLVPVHPDSSHLESAERIGPTSPSPSVAVQCGEERCWHGTCDASGDNSTSKSKCVCSVGYYGPDCGTFCDATVSCSGHGRCLVTMSSICADDPEWSESTSGRSCSQYAEESPNHLFCTEDVNSQGVTARVACPLSCGTCPNVDMCQCAPGYSGRNCEVECSGHGSKIDGRCICESGYSGSLCEVCSCPSFDLRRWYSPSTRLTVHFGLFLLVD